MSMPGKRNSECIECSEHPSPPKKQESVSDIIGPLINQIPLKRSQSVLSEELGKTNEEDGTDGCVLKVGLEVLDVMSSAINTMVDGIENVVEEVIGQAPCEEERPSNNVHVSHPVLGDTNMVSLGMHIQPFSYGHVNGHKVLTVDKGKLADQAKLRENDILVAVNDTCTKEYTLEEVLKLFGTISKTFSLTVIRTDSLANGDDIPKYESVTITVTLEVTDDRVVRVASVNVKTMPVIYMQTVPSKFIIAQKTGATSLTRYLKIKDDDTVTMDSLYVAQQCKLTMNLYLPNRDGPVPVCTFCNDSNSKALDARNDADEQYKIVLGDAADLTHGRTLSDYRFFYYHSTGLPNEKALESVEKKDHFLTFEGGVLKLMHQRVESVRSLPVACRFTVCAAGCDTDNKQKPSTARQLSK